MHFSILKFDRYQIFVNALNSLIFFLKIQFSFLTEIIWSFCGWKNSCHLRWSYWYSIFYIFSWLPHQFLLMQVHRSFSKVYLCCTIWSYFTWLILQSELATWYTLKVIIFFQWKLLKFRWSKLNGIFGHKLSIGCLIFTEKWGTRHLKLRIKTDVVLDIYNFYYKLRNKKF